MELTFFTDLHLYSSCETTVELPEKADGKTFFLGDISDWKSAYYTFVDAAWNLVLNLRKRFGSDYIEGNHEGCKEYIRKTIPIDKEDGSKVKLTMTHGHFICCAAEQAIKLSTFTPGRGHIVRFFKWIGFRLRNLYVGKLGADELIRAYALAQEEGSQIVVFGHKHPRKMIDVEYNKVRMICLPRGMTKIKF